MLSSRGALIFCQLVLGEHLNWHAEAVCGNFRDLVGAPLLRACRSSDSRRRPRNNCCLGARIVPKRLKVAIAPET